MSAFKFEKVDFEDAYLIDTFFCGDVRGRFNKSFEKEIFHNAGIDFSVDETFLSVSAKNVIRGLHFQTRNPQAKLVTVLKGKAYDVIVDLRPQSSTFKQWRAYELSEYNHRSLYVPRNFAHGFLSLEDETIMLYQCDGKYNGETDTGIRFDDPNINVKWPVDIGEAVVSQRDSELRYLQEFDFGKA